MKHERDCAGSTAGPCAATEAAESAGADLAIRALSASAIAAQVRAGTLDPGEVALVFGRRIAQCNPQLNAVVGEPFFVPAAGCGLAPAPWLAEDIAALRTRLAAGEPLPLAGVPVLVKDVIWVRGRRIAQGSLLFKDFVAPADAQCVARLRQAGALIVGIANSSEFACKGRTDNRLYGLTRHPMDPSLTPGGSSGGSATGVAAQMAPLALGTDGGGSSRRPPAHVGAVGFKPSYGAVPDAVGFAHAYHGILCVAPIARDVADAALMFDAMAGSDRLDPASIELAPAGATPPRALRVAYSPRLGLQVPVDPDVQAAVESAVERLRAHGFDLRRADPVWPAGATEDALLPLQFAGVAHLFGDEWKRDPAQFDPDIARQIESGLAATGTGIARAREASSQVAGAMARFFGDFDVLVCPTTPCVAWRNDRLGPQTIGGVAVPGRGHAVFTPFFNHAMVPVISIPCGNGRNQLPVGLQLVAARGQDRTLLRFALAAEQALEAAHPRVSSRRIPTPAGMPSAGFRPR